MNPLVKITYVGAQWIFNEWINGWILQVRKSDSEWQRSFLRVTQPISSREGRELVPQTCIHFSTSQQCDLWNLPANERISIHSLTSQPCLDGSTRHTTFGWVFFPLHVPSLGKFYKPPQWFCYHQESDALLFPLVTLRMPHSLTQWFLSINMLQPHAAFGHILHILTPWSLLASCALASFFSLQNLSIPQGLAYFPFLEESPLTSGSPCKILIYSLYHLVLITQLGLDKHCHDWHIYLFYT